MGKTILISSALYAPHVGGVEKYSENLARQLASMGHEVYLVTYQISMNHPIQETIDKVRIIRLPSKGTKNYRYPIPRKNTRYKSQLKWISTLPLDAVIINTRFYLLSYEISKIAYEKGIRPIMIEHGSAHLTAGNILADIGITRAEHALTNRIKSIDADYYGVSKTCNRWLEHFGITAKGILPNAIDAKLFRLCSSNKDFRSEYGIGNDEFLICFIARYNKEKGVAKILGAAQRFSRSNGIHFIFAGDGPMKNEIDNCGLDHVHSVGPLCKEDVSALLQTSDAFCLPSRSEGFPTALLEAAACGTTPIITPVGGVEELIPTSEYGIIIESTSSRNIAKAINALRRDQFKCEQMGYSIKQHVEDQYTWRKTADKVIDAIESAANAPQAQ